MSLDTVMSCKKETDRESPSYTLTGVDAECGISRSSLEKPVDVKLEEVSDMQPPIVLEHEKDATKQRNIC